MIYKVETTFKGPYMQHWLYISAMKKWRWEKSNQMVTKVPYIPDALTVVADYTHKFKGIDAYVYAVKEKIKDSAAWTRMWGGKYKTLPAAGDDGHGRKYGFIYANYKEGVVFKAENVGSYPERGGVVSSKHIGFTRSLEDCVVVANNNMYGGTHKVLGINLDKNLVAVSAAYKTRLYLEDFRLVPLVMGRMISMTFNMPAISVEFEIPAFWTSTRG